MYTLLCCDMRKPLISVIFGLLNFIELFSDSRVHDVALVYLFCSSRVHDVVLVYVLCASRVHDVVLVSEVF